MDNQDIFLISFLCLLELLPAIVFLIISGTLFGLGLNFSPIVFLLIGLSFLTKEKPEVYTNIIPKAPDLPKKEEIEEEIDEETLVL